MGSERLYNVKPLHKPLTDGWNFFLSAGLPPIVQKKSLNLGYSITRQKTFGELFMEQQNNIWDWLRLVTTPKTRQSKDIKWSAVPLPCYVYLIRIV